MYTDRSRLRTGAPLHYLTSDNVELVVLLDVVFSVKVCTVAVTDACHRHFPLAATDLGLGCIWLVAEDRNSLSLTHTAHTSYTPPHTHRWVLAGSHPFAPLGRILLLDYLTVGGRNPPSGPLSSWQLRLPSLASLNGSSSVSLVSGHQCPL